MAQQKIKRHRTYSTALLMPRISTIVDAFFGIYVSEVVGWNPTKYKMYVKCMQTV